MSEQTYGALEDAIRTHLADHAEGNLLTDWVLLTASVGNEMRLTTYIDCCSESPSHTLEGLIARGQRRIIARDQGDEDE